MKTLDTYFDEWIYVDSSNLVNTDAPLSIEWCTSTFGIRGLYWDCRWKLVSKNKINSRGLNKWCFMFKKEEHALLFILKYGGTIIENGVENV